jgi:chromosomal replication initiation ATPase DnaA
MVFLYLFKTHTMFISPYVYVGLNHLKVSHKQPRILFERVLASVSKDFDLAPEVLISRRRWRDCCYGRQIISFILRHHYRMTVTKIGSLLNRHHSSIIHVTNQHLNDYECSIEYRETTNRILRRLGLWVL